MSGAERAGIYVTASSMKRYSAAGASPLPLRLLCLFLLVACSPHSNSEASEDHALRVGDRTAHALGADSDELKYFPLSKYKKYPDSVRSLIRRADIENDRCRGRFNDQTLLACNRRERIMAELEKKGWCWGGSQVGYSRHWLKCADDPYYQPGGHGPDSLYSEGDIR